MMAKEINKIEVMEDIYEENGRLARELNTRLSAQGIFAVNVLGSPGTGKTSALLQITKMLLPAVSYVIEGDIESNIDTVTLQKAGVDAFQINTYGGCHLDAPMMIKALEKFALPKPGYLFIENVGNLVCPAEFEIGEHLKLLICSTTEGSDKPYKYPLIFEKAAAVVLNKIDLMPHLDFDKKFFIDGLRGVNKSAPLFEVSSKTGEGFDALITWFKAKKG
jgi:hydrogenase nickel incorporation protein HypB